MKLSTSPGHGARDPTRGASSTAVSGTWSPRNSPPGYTAAGLTPKDTSPADLRKAIAAGIPLTTARPWPHLTTILADVLTAPAPERPTAGELADGLAAVTSRTCALRGRDAMHPFG
ncbi:hypothetical protein [Kitasatospora sp. GAS204B]|uniref:hypothetical protein n=1 Tax=unclassified Kitasatospora TaxID=2633591 RepID=UPI0024735F71|nr:hypothetical protein [Kitasatospora sp. GAS204B]MDH6118163.1 hypothetical protein [Kitasatospora sp. GAS204B]